MQQLFRALSEREYAEELSRSMEALDPPAPAPQEPKAPAKTELLSVRNLLAGIVILLSVLILLILWGLLSRQSEKPPEVIAPESVSEAASEPVNENVTLTPNFVGRDYDAEVRNNHSYIDEYLFYVTLEYSDTVEKGCIIRQSPEAGEVIQKGDTVSLVVSRGPQMMEMPDVIGQTQDSAVQELATKGLNATCFTVVNDGSEAAGCVVSASEDAGSMVEVGTTIVLYRRRCPRRCPGGTGSAFGYRDARRRGCRAGRRGIRYGLNKKRPLASTSPSRLSPCHLPSVGERSAKQTERLSNSLLFLFQKLQKKLFMNAISLAARAGTASSRRTGRTGWGRVRSISKPPL